MIDEYNGAKLARFDKDKWLALDPEKDTQEVYGHLLAEPWPGPEWQMETDWTGNLLYNRRDNNFKYVLFSGRYTGETFTMKYTDTREGEVNLYGLYLVVQAPWDQALHRVRVVFATDHPSSKVLLCTKYSQTSDGWDRLGERYKIIPLAEYYEQIKPGWVIGFEMYTTVPSYGFKEPPEERPKGVNTFDGQVMGRMSKREQEALQALVQAWRGEGPPVKLEDLILPAWDYFRIPAEESQCPF